MAKGQRRKRRPTQADVANLAGVSQTTVSQVLNDADIAIPEETRQRILDAMNELGYVPNRMARSLRSGETCTIGMIVPDSANPFFAEVARGVEDASFEQGYSVILCNSDGNLDKELLYSDVLTEMQIDGILFIAAGLSKEHIQTLQERRIPLVVVDREIPDIALDSVLADNTKGGWLATRHLIELGHHRIGCIQGPSDLSPSADRIIGYRRALEEAGIPVDEEIIVRGGFQYEGGHQATRRLLAGEKPPTAIFACNDLMAVGAISAAVEMGYQIPDDLSVVGYDDLPLARFANPPLTTVVQPKHEIGTIAATMLLERIRDMDAPSHRRVLDTSMCVRRSTAHVK
jgi:LacI family transcriptional regulator